MKRVVVRPAATADIEDAYGWYESRQPGLDEQFLAALRSVQERLLDHPESFLSCTATPGAPECHVTGEMIGR